MKGPKLFSLGWPLVFSLLSCAGNSTNKAGEPTRIITAPVETAVVESPKQFHQRTSVEFLWKNNDLVELAPGVTLNIQNGSLFYQGRTQVETLRFACNTDASGAECTVSADRVATAIAPNGAMIWLSSGDGALDELQICIRQPAVANCSDLFPAEASCYELHHVARHYPPKAIVHAATTLADPLFQALQETETIYLRDRGLTAEGDGDACFAWHVDSEHSQDDEFWRNTVRLTRIEQQGGTRVELAWTISFSYGYTWNWSKGSQPGTVDLTKVVPIAAETRECFGPTDGVIDDDADGDRGGMGKIMSMSTVCSAPLGDFRGADADSIELSKTSFYKTLAACEQSRTANLQGGIPRCEPL